MLHSFQTALVRHHRTAVMVVASQLWLYKYRSDGSSTTRNEPPSDKDPVEKLLSSAKQTVERILLSGNQQLQTQEPPLSDEDKQQPQQPQQQQQPKEDNELSFETIGRNFLDLLSGRAEQTAVTDIISQARQRSSQGEVEDTTSITDIFDMLDSYKDQLGQVANKFLADIDLFQLTPTALLYYLERQDETKNPSWKRRVHRFCWGIDSNQMDHLNDACQLALLSYADTLAQVQDGLLERGYELLDGTVLSKPGQPAHFLAVQTTTNKTLPNHLELLLLIRGTKTVADAITDLLCDTVDYRGGKAHSLILESGQFVVGQHLTSIQQLQKKAGQRLHITVIGHSLGAGAAAIAGMELKDMGISTQVVGFGCPALLSQKLAQDTAPYVTTVVNDDDMVPRMSGASVANLLRDILEFDWIPYAKRDVEGALMELHRTNPALFSKAVTGRIVQQIGEFMDSHLNDSILETTNERIPVELFPPGTCLHFYRDGVGVSGCIVPNTFFSSIDISRRMLDDHVFQTGYVKTLLDIERQRTGDHHFRFRDE